jgi:hypothetical protein
LRQEDCEFKASLGCVERPCLKNSKRKERKMEGGREEGRNGVGGKEGLIK